MRFTMIFFLAIFLNAENNFKLMINDINSIYEECVSETEKQKGCQNISISNYKLYVNFLNFKLEKNDKLANLKNLSFEDKKSFLTKEIERLLSLYEKKRDINIQYDIEYSKFFNQSYLDDYNQMYEDCDNKKDTDKCIDKVKSLELKDLENYKNNIAKLLTKDKKVSFLNEQQEWQEYQNIYAEILKNNFNNEIVTDVYDGSMWNDIEDELYYQTFAQRRAKLKSYLDKLKSK